MSEDLVQKVKFEGEESVTKTVERIRAQMKRLAEDAKRLKPATSLIDETKVLQSFSRINKALEKNGNTWHAALKRNINEAQKFLKDGTFQTKWKEGLGYLTQLDKKLEKTHGKKKGFSAEEMNWMRRVDAMRQVILNSHDKELDLLGDKKIMHAQIAEVEARGRERVARASRTSQREIDKEIKAQERRAGVKGRVGGNAWGPDQGAHVRVFKAMQAQANKLRSEQNKTIFGGNANDHVKLFRQVQSERKAEDKAVFGRIRAQIGLLDRSAKEETKRLRGLDAERRKSEAYHNKLKKQVTGGFSHAGHSGMHAVRSMSHPFFSSPAFLAMASLTTALYGLTRIIEDGAKIDKAVVDLSLRGNLPEGAIQGRTNTALKNSIQYGVGAEHFLAIDTETGARGLPQEMQKSLGPQIMKFAEATGQRPEEAAKHSSEFIQQLWSMGKIKNSNDAFKVLNTTAAVANSFGGSDKMMEAMENGLAERGSEMGLNPKDSVTLAGLMNSSGARSGLVTSRAMGLLSKGAPNWKSEWLNKIQHGDMSDSRTRAFVTAPQTLGYGSMDQMASAAHGEQGLKGVLDFLTSFKRIENDSQRKMLEEQFGFTEQMGGVLEGLINSPDKVSRAKALADKTYGESDNDQSYSSTEQKKYRKGLEYMLGVFTSGFEVMAYKIENQLKTRVLAKLIGPWQQLSNWAIDHLPATIDTIVNSLMTGLGFLDVRGKGSIGVFVQDMQKNLLAINWATVGLDVGLAIKGVGEGISALGKDLHYALSFVSKFTGDGSIEGLARLTTEMFGFALAIHAITPVIGVFASIVSGISALKGVLTGAKALGLLMGVGGAAEGAGATAAIGGAMAATGVGLAAMLGVAVVGGALAVAIMNWDAIKGWFGSWLPSLGVDPKDNPAKATPESDSYWAKKKKYLHLQSFDGDGQYGNLLTKASYSPSDSGEVVKDAMVDSSRTIIEVRDELIQTNELLRNSTLGLGSSDTGYGGGGGSGGGAANMRYGHNRAGGYNSTPGTGSYGNPSKSLLDFIAQSEGGGYNVSWGNGKFLPGGKEQNLTGKSLNDIIALGNYMRQQPGSKNSSAMGRYQMTGSTIKDLMGRLGLKGTEKFDEAMQDKLASKLIADEGPRALGRWESLKSGGRMATAMGLLQSGQIASQPSASGPSVAMSGDAAARIQTMRKAGLLSDEQCVTLAMASVGIHKGSGLGGNVHDWRAGVGADAGTLKPGTPISTFLNRNGSQSNLFAGGGSGTPGAGLDHAGMFEKYILDAAGKRIGFVMAEQYKNSHGVHDKSYYFGKGAGEGNGSNYRAVMAGGQGLGGDNNPLNVKIDPKSIAKNTPSDIAKKVGAPSDDDSAFKKAGGQSADASGGASHHVQLHFHGMGNHDPAQIASLVGKELENTLGSRSHDIDHYVG